MRTYHPLGNFKIALMKNFSNFLSEFILFFLSFIFKIKKNESEIIISPSFYAPWKENKKFYFFYEKIKDLTLLDTKRLYTLWYFSNNLKDVNANILEVGCLRGGTGFLMSKANKKGNTYLCDTFEGFVEEEKFHKKNHFVYKNIDEVRKNVKRLKLKNTKIYKCKFPNKLSVSFKKKKFKLCHLDVNTYKSTKESFQFIQSRIVRGGVIVFDDYGIYGVDSVKSFVNQISKKYKKKFSFVYNFMGQCLLIKK